MVFLLKYLKYIAPIAGGVLLLYGAYLYGSIKAKHKQEVSTLKETIKRLNEENKVIKKSNDVIDKFRKTKGTPLTPEKVKTYECLLSDNPLDC